MIDGIITLTKSGSGKLYGRIVWEAESQGTAANTSKVTAKIQLHRPEGFTTTGTWNGSLTVGGTSVSISYYGAIGSSWVTVKNLSVTVSHNTDGSGTCYIYGKVNAPGGTSIEGASVSGSETITLEKIARYASIVSVSAFTDEGNPVVTYSNPAGEEVEIVETALSVDGINPVVAYRSISKTGTIYTFQLTDAERNALRSAAFNSNALTVFVLLRSVINDLSNVSKTTVTMTIVNADPTVSPEIVDTNSNTIALTGDGKILVALHSVAQVTVNATAKKYAEISSVKVEHGAVILNGDGTLNVTNNPIKITVTDSRGNTVTHTANNTIIPYINPSAVIENSIPNAIGEMQLCAIGKFYDGSFGKTANAFSVKYRAKEGGSSYGDWIAFDSATLDGFDFEAEASVTGLDYQKTYTFQVAVFDSLHPEGVFSAERKFVARPVVDWSNTDFNFNVPVTMSGNTISGLGDALDETGAVSLAYGRKVFAPAGNYTGIVKMWENDRPTENFDEQTIELPFSSDEMALVFFVEGTDASTRCSAFIRCGESDRILGTYGSVLTHRRVKLETNGVTIYGGNRMQTYGEWSASNKVLIPITIYKITDISDPTLDQDTHAICGEILCGEAISGQ